MAGQIFVDTPSEEVSIASSSMVQNTTATFSANFSETMLRKNTTESNFQSMFSINNCSGVNINVNINKNDKNLDLS